MSLIMLFNKIQDVIDLSEFLKLPQESLSRIVRDTPEAIIDIIVSVMESLCGKIDATEEETRKCVSKVKERKRHPLSALHHNVYKETCSPAAHYGASCICHLYISAA